MSVGLVSMWQASEISVREEFVPTLEVEGSLAFGGTELDRQRHLEMLCQCYEQGKRGKTVAGSHFSVVSGRGSLKYAFFTFRWGRA